MFLDGIEKQYAEELSTFIIVCYLFLILVIGRWNPETMSLYHVLMANVMTLEVCLQVNNV